jgi:hypothetical protein
MLRASSEVIDYAVELGAHLSRIFILVFLFFFIDLIMLFRELLPLIVLKVVSRILGVTFLLLILILLIKGHLVDLIIKFILVIFRFPFLLKIIGRCIELVLIVIQVRVLLLLMLIVINHVSCIRC